MKKFFKDLFSKKEVKTEEFVDKIVITENVNEELLKVSKEFNLPLSALDFDILNVKTYISIQDNEFVEADEHTLDVIKSEKFLLSSQNKIKQVYEIRIKKYKMDDKFEIIGKLQINSLYTDAKFILSPQSKIEDFNEIRFYDEMNKKKLRNSLLIGIFDKKMQEDINKLNDLLLVSKLKEPFVIQLCRGIDPIPTVQGDVIYVYKQKRETFKKELIYPVKVSDVILKIIKPKEGRGGRNCKGEYLEVEKLEKFSIPRIEFDNETIEKKEDNDKILFLAKKAGYIVIEDDKYFIRDKLEIRKIDIKTGNVKDGDDGVKMEIKDSNFMDEAIGDGMIVEAKEVIVRGNVGNKSKVKAKKIEVRGKTHKNSIIKADFAKINTLRGKLKAKEVYVDILENGKIKAQKVKVNYAIGGEIVAKEIEIENLTSHVKIYGLKIIDIKYLKGEENLLCISPKKVLDEIDVDILNKKLKEIERNIEIVKREILKKKKILDKNKQTYEDLKKLYVQNKKSNRKTSPSVLMKLKEYKIFYQKFNELKDKFENLKIKKEEILEEIDIIQNAIYNAKIINHSKWKAYNRIEFDLLEPPVKLTYDTKGDEGICGFKLKFDFDTPQIVKIKVENDSGS